MLKEKNCKATVAAKGRELAVFGRDDHVVDALAPLGAKKAGVIKLDPASESWALGLLYDALVKGLSRYRPLIPLFKRAGHSLIVAAPRDVENSERACRNEQVLARLRDAYGSELTGKVPKLEFPFHEGIFLKLERIDDRWWCGFEPYTFVQTPRLDLPVDANPVEPESASFELMKSALNRGGDPAGDWRRERWAQKYNRHWASIIDAWAQLLTETEDGKVRAFGLDEGSGFDAVFEVSPITGWSRPSHHHVYFERRK